MGNRLGRRLALGVAGIAGIGMLATGPSALASTVHYPVTATTSAVNFPDRFHTVTGPCTVPSQHGPIWAYDNLSFTFKVVPSGRALNQYIVTIKVDGTFKAVADPLTGNCPVARAKPAMGTMNGTLTYIVTSPTPPRKPLPKQEPSGLNQFQMANQLFGGNAVITGGGSYSYVYHKTGGTWTVVGNFYTQTG